MIAPACIRTTALAVALALPFTLAACGGGNKTSSTQSTSTPIGGTLPGGGIPGGTPTTPGGIAAGTTYALVSSAGGRSVDVYDVATGQISTSLSFPTGRPVDVGIEANQRQAFVANLNEKTIEEFALPTGSFAGFGTPTTIDLSQAPISQYPLLMMLDPILRIGYAPMGVCAIGNKAYIPAMISVTVIENGFVKKGIMDLGPQAAGSFLGLLSANVETLGSFRAVAANGKVYVSNFLSGTVTVIDTATDDRIATVAVGRGPAGLAVDSTGQHVYVCCALSGEVWPIDTTTDAPGAPILAGVGPIDAAAGPNGYLYVTNYLSGDISVIDTYAGATVDTLQAANMTSLLAALGMSPQQMQAIVNQLLGAFGGAASGGTTTAGGFSTFLNLLLGGTGASSSGSVIATMMNQLLQSFFAQAGGTGGGIPVAGLWGIGINPGGTALVVSNAVTGQVSFIDIPTRTIVNSAFPSLATGQLTIPAVSSVEVFTK
jgi:YVTN family beta-propeller protein